MPLALDELRRQDPAWRIINYKHEVVVPRYATIDLEFVDSFGLTVDEENNPNEELHLFVTMARLLEYHRNGAVPRFKDRDRAKMIVDDIAELINAWRTAVTQGVDVVEPPMEYLDQLDEFSRAIFPQARIARALDIRNNTIPLTELEKYMSQRSKIKVPNDDTRIDRLPDEPTSALDIIARAHRERFGE